MTTIKIGTFNIAAGQQPDLEAIKRLISTYQLDVVALQEVDCYTQRQPKDMLQIIGQAYNDYAFAPTIPLLGGYYGIGVVSQLPLLTQTYTAYQHTGAEKRVYQRVSIKLGKKTIAVYNTHLAFESPEIRQQQISELLAVIQQDQSDYQIIMGDFNMDQSLAEWDIFSPTFKMANGYQNNWLETFNGRDQTMRSFAIDNILISQKLDFQEILMAPTILSDHQLLIATIQLPAEIE